MKKSIHPPYYPNAKIECACGNVITVGGTREKIEVESCSNCHPLYTGKQLSAHRGSRIERFRKHMQKHEELESASKVKEQKTSS